jgi:hypothetical protein
MSAGRGRKAIKRMNKVQRIEERCRFKMLTDCISKQTYTSEDEAAWATSTILAKGERRPVRPAQPYQCKVCDKWHLTSRKVIS